MQARIRVVHDDGDIQIDQDYSNYLFASKVTVTTDTSFGSQGASYKDIVVTSATRPVLALQSFTEPATYTLVSVSGSTWTFRVWVGPTGTVYDTTGLSVTVYIFDIHLPISGLPGIRVFDSSGNLKFDSGHKPMRVLSMLVNPSGNPIYSGSGQVAFLPARAGGRAEVYGIPGQTSVYNAYFFDACKSSSSSSVSKSAILYYFGDAYQGGTTGPLYSCPSDWIIIDVSNY